MQRPLEKDKSPSAGPKPTPGGRWGHFVLTFTPRLWSPSTALVADAGVAVVGVPRSLEALYGMCAAAAPDTATSAHADPSAVRASSRSSLIVHISAAKATARTARFCSLLYAFSRCLTSSRNRRRPAHTTKGITKYTKTQTPPLQELQRPSSKYNTTAHKEVRLKGFFVARLNKKHDSCSCSNASTQLPLNWPSIDRVWVRTSTPCPSASKGRLTPTPWPSQS